MRGIVVVTALTLTTTMLWPVPLRALHFYPLHAGDWLLCTLLFGLSFLLFWKRDRLGGVWSSLLLGIVLGTILAFGLNIIRLMRWNVQLPPEWDFHLFWVFGRVASQGLNPYDQENLLRVAASLSPSSELLQELFFFHSPPTLFLFLPLGWFDIRTAYLVWYCAQVIVLLVDLFLIWKLFLKDAGMEGALFVLCLVVLLRSTFMTVAFGQTNFIVLLMVLLYWRDWKSARGGVWLALGIAVKPVLVFLVLFPALRRRWGTLAVAAVTGGFLLLVSAIAFGPAMVLSYFSHNPVVIDLPTYLYTEDMNQSLLATILRLSHTDPSGGSPYANPVFWVTAALLVIVSCWMTLRLKEEDAPWGLSLILVLSLLIFPKTLEHYALLLIVPLAMLWSLRSQVPGGAAGSAAGIILVVALVNARAPMVFVAMALAWLCVGWVVWLRAMGKEGAPPPPLPST
jgi:hypothetical protein